MSTFDENVSEFIGKSHRKAQFENIVKSFFFYIIVLVVFIWCVFPFFYAFVQSFINATTRTSYEFLPSNPSMTNYDTVFTTFNFQKYIINSAYISIITTVLCVIIAAFAGYVLATFSFSGKPILMIIILSMTMFPGIIIAIPLLRMYVIWGQITNVPITNTYIPGLLIPYIAFNLPLTVFLLYNFFQEIPRELILAARVDGASNFQVFQKVILPLAIPGVFTTAILVFIASWNEFLFASILLNGVQNGTVPLALANFQGIPSTGVIYDPLLALMAACVIVTLPLVIVVLIFQQQIVSGITAGAVKG